MLSIPCGNDLWRVSPTRAGSALNLWFLRSNASSGRRQMMSHILQLHFNQSTHSSSVRQQLTQVWGLQQVTGPVRAAAPVQVDPTAAPAHVRTSKRLARNRKWIIDCRRGSDGGRSADVGGRLRWRSSAGRPTAARRRVASRPLGCLTLASV